MDKWSFGQGPKKRAPISKMRKGQKQHKKFLLYKQTAVNKLRKAICKHGMENASYNVF